MIPPIRAFVTRWTDGAKVIVDPFCGQSQIATHRNDINPKAPSKEHLTAQRFLRNLALNRIVADVVLFDPPYSPRQIMEHYKSAGLLTSKEDTQNGKLYAECRDGIGMITKPGSIVLSFGWNSIGMGSGWERLETLLVYHGGAHNDTICVADRKAE